MNSPATSERIRMACADSIAAMCMQDETKESVATFQPKATY